MGCLVRNIGLILSAAYALAYRRVVMGDLISLKSITDMSTGTGDFTTCCHDTVAAFILRLP